MAKVDILVLFIAAILTKTENRLELLMGNEK